MWGITVLGAAAKPVTEQQFTELENGIYEKAKILQDTASSIQSDQIDFLNNNISTIFTICGIAVGILTALAGGAITFIINSNIKAKQQMEKAQTLMAAAQELTEATNKKTQYLETKQRELEDLINSKQLNEKLVVVDSLTQAHNKMLLQEQVKFILEQASTFLERAKNYIIPLDTDGTIIREAISKIRTDIDYLETSVKMRKEEVFFLLHGSVVDEDKLLKKAHELNAEAIEIEQKGKEFYSTHRHFPSVDSES
ncbi:hypothetical protein ACNHOZ_27755 [Priestia sp. D51]